MKIDTAILDAMLGAGCTAEQVVAVVKAACSQDEEREERKRAGNAERQRRFRQRNAQSRVTDVTNCDAPVPPVSDKENPPAPPKEINSSPLTPQTTLPSANAHIDFQELAEKLDKAADGKIHSSSLLLVGPVVELIIAGASLELDILPAVRATAARSEKSFPLAYHLPGMRQAYERRIGAARDLPKPKALDTSDNAWRKRLTFARTNRIWDSAELGPAPGAPGSLVPAHLIIAGDGIGWNEVANQRRTAA